ncbi:MAG: diguanylate cyclase [Gammaproteobacteria bacterium]|nr:diguanylate cyclase [Gammaproteobacteria bacterium]
MNHLSDSGKANIAEQLKALQLAYARDLPGKIADVKSHWLKLLETGWDKNLITEAHRKTHSLAGSGASFGFPEVSRCARELEMDLKAIKEQGQLPGPDQIELMQHRLDALISSANGPDSDTSNTDTKPSGQTLSQPRTIFVLNDVDEYAGKLCKELDRFGYQTECFHDDATIMARLQKVCPGGIIAFQPASGELPNFRSFQEAMPNVLPVIVLANHDNFGHRLAAVRSGSDAFLPANTDPAKIVDKLEQLNLTEKTDPYRVLIIDDSEALATQYALILKQAGMIAEIVNDPLKINDKLSSFLPELMLVDMYMPEFNGAELAKVLRQHEAYVGIPIVFLSAETNVDKQIGAMANGGDEFLTKPIHPVHLVSSVSNRIERYRVLRSMMERDSLTGLLNHTKIKERIELEIARAQRQKSPISLAMIDLDDFKKVNDTYGHAIGDNALKLLSKIMKQRLRRTDILGRYGGEEFAVILPDTGLDTALAIMEDVRENFSRIPLHSNDETFCITFSCGLACYPDYTDASALNSAADQALYNAKKMGKNRVETRKP